VSCGVLPTLQEKAKSRRAKKAMALVTMPGQQQAIQGTDKMKGWQFYKI
jgi:hypothetical protein